MARPPPRVGNETKKERKGMGHKKQMRAGTSLHAATHMVLTRVERHTLHTLLSEHKHIPAQKNTGGCLPLHTCGDKGQAQGGCFLLSYSYSIETQ